MIDRYTLPRMKAIWELEAKFQWWLKIELLACEAWSELGVIPREAVARIKERAGFTVERVLEIEAVTRHDVIAFTTAVGERLGEDSRYFHYGLTSSDVVDTALACQLREAATLILEDLDHLGEAIARQARRHKNTVVIGRTHGVHAEPTTFGLKLANWYTEIQRNKARLERARAGISFGKLSGAVGNFANVPPFIEEYVCRKLGLEPDPVSTQILQRDRHAEYLTTMAIIAGSLDRFATEIRGLQRTEIREVEEPFREGQKGSSAMPHKRNPVTCEQISGLARVVRSNAQAALENMALWHERDISHSSVERIILPDSTILIDYMVNTFREIVENLHVYPENMQRNLEKTGGLIFSQRVLLALARKGLTREEAYRLVQEHAMTAWQGQKTFKELLAEDERVQRILSPEELAECFDYRPYLQWVDEIFRRAGLE